MVASSARGGRYPDSVVVKTVPEATYAIQAFAFGSGEDPTYSVLVDSYSAAADGVADANVDAATLPLSTFSGDRLRLFDEDRYRLDLPADVFSEGEVAVWRDQALWEPAPGGTSACCVSPHAGR